MEIFQSAQKIMCTYAGIGENMSDKNNIDLTTKLVLYFIPYRLRTKLDQSMLVGLPREYLIPPKCPTELQQLLAKRCLEMEDSNGAFFDGLARTLDLSTANAKNTFYGVAKEIIKDGVHWGRIIATFTFAGVLSHHFMTKKQPAMVVEIAKALITFLNSHIMPWINMNGGWDGMIEKMSGKSNFWTNALAIGGIISTGYLLLSGR